MFAGVCGGIAEYFGVDPTLVRLAAVVLALLGGSGLFIYGVAWIIMPKP
jgi:phage shock protein PspC (stress-responsive transcriptional regulator)